MHISPGERHRSLPARRHPDRGTRDHGERRGRLESHPRWGLGPGSCGRAEPPRNESSPWRNQARQIVRPECSPLRVGPVLSQESPSRRPGHRHHLCVVNAGHWLGHFRPRGPLSLPWLRRRHSSRGAEGRRLTLGSRGSGLGGGHRHGAREHEQGPGQTTRRVRTAGWPRGTRSGRGKAQAPDEEPRADAGRSPHKQLLQPLLDGAVRVGALAEVLDRVHTGLERVAVAGHGPERADDLDLVAVVQRARVPHQVAVTAVVPAAREAGEPGTSAKAPPTAGSSGTLPCGPCVSLRRHWGHPFHRRVHGRARSHPDREGPEVQAGLPGSLLWGPHVTRGGVGAVRRASPSQRVTTIAPDLQGPRMRSCGPLQGQGPPGRGRPCVDDSGAGDRAGEASSKSGFSGTL